MFQVLLHQKVKGNDMSLLLDDFRIAMAAIKSYIKKTSLIRCKELEKRINSPYKVFLKLESEQLTKSFKIRGAFNVLLALKNSEKIKGVVTRSSGNFAQAVAYAGKFLGIKITVVMPINAPEIKKTETQKYNPSIVLAGVTHEEGNLMVEKLKLETGAIQISPYNQLEVIKGQGTIALEIYEELSMIRHFFCPIGGGGLMSGCATALKLLNSNIETIGIEPEGANDYYLYRLKGHQIKLQAIKTICDGLRAPQVGELNRPLLDQYVDIVSTVSDISVIKAMKFLNENCGLMVEPSGAAAVAGLFEHSKSLNGDTVCVISGANITENSFKELMKEGLNA